MDPLKRETISEILDLAGGDDVILIELLSSFLDDAKQLSKGIEEAVKRSDWQKLKFEVHTLKGLCGTIGAKPLFETCKVLNNEIKKGNFAVAVDLAKEISVHYEVLISHITANYNIKYEA